MLGSAQPDDHQGRARAAAQQHRDSGQHEGVKLEGDGGIRRQVDLDLIFKAGDGQRRAMMDAVLFTPLMTRRLPMSRAAVVFTW